MLGKVLVRRFADVYKQAAQQTKVKQWTTRLQKLANTPQSKGTTSQLSNLIAFYTKRAPQQPAPINWEEWQSKITTEGLVKTVKSKFEELDKKEYDIDGIATKVNSTESKALEDIRNELNYHTALWLSNYGRYLSSTLGLEEYTLDMTAAQMDDFFPFQDYAVQELVETHNYLPGSKDDINLRAYIVNQFAWGKKVISFYRHPADEFKCFKATKSVLGR